jgi:hypothetical protein
MLCAGAKVLCSAARFCVVIGFPAFIVSLEIILRVDLNISALTTDSVWQSDWSTLMNNCNDKDKLMPSFWDIPINLLALCWYVAQGPWPQLAHV